MSLAKNIRNHRLEQRYTRIGLARLVGCSKSHIYQIESGIVKKPSAELVAEIAKVFGVKIEELMGSEDKIERV